MPFVTTIKAATFQPRVVVAGGTPSASGSSQLELGVHFYNGLNRNVSVVTRTGLRFQLPPEPTSKHNTLTIRRLNSVRSNVLIDRRGLFNDVGLSVSEEAKALDAAYPRQDTRPGGFGKEIAVVDYVLDMKDFTRHGGVLYLAAFDVVLSIMDPSVTPLHPFSIGGISERTIAEHALLNTGTGFEYVIELVDNRGQYGPRYLNIAGRVFQVPAIFDHERQDGVYVTTSVPATGDSKVVCPQSVFLTLEEAEVEYKLYSSVEQARTLGNPESARDRELKEWTHQIKQSEHQFKEEQQNWQRDKLQQDMEAERQKRTFERERESAKHSLALREEALKSREQIMQEREQDFRIEELRQKQRLSVLKETSDFDSTIRKERLELLKMAPAIINGLGAVFVVIKALKR